MDVRAEMIDFFKFAWNVSVKSGSEQIMCAGENKSLCFAVGGRILGYMETPVIRQMRVCKNENKVSKEHALSTGNNSAHT